MNLVVSTITCKFDMILKSRSHSLYSHLTFPKEPIPIVFPRRYCPRITGTMSIFMMGSWPGFDMEVSKLRGQLRVGKDDLS